MGGVIFQIPVFALIFCHLLARKPNLENISINSNKFFHNFHLSESSRPTLQWLWNVEQQ
jgi:hypothetical protein